MKAANGRFLGAAAMVVLAWAALAAAQAGDPPAAPASPVGPATQPTRVYVPYEQLSKIFGSEKQGVFLPYDEFQRLWRAAQGAPAGVEAAPLPYLISSARFTGKVGAELASMQMELTLDVLADGWVEIPVGLGEVAVAKAAFAAAAPARPDAAADTPLLRVVNGQYFLVARGKGRRVLNVDFVRQLVTQPGLNVLSFKMPAAAISTLDLTIPEENMKVDVEPMLAASTKQDVVDGKKVTQLRAFLGSSESVKLSWKPKTQAAEELESVVIEDQFQQIEVSEAVISHEVRFTYDIRRRGVDRFTIQLPRDFRVIAVDGANIAKWDVAGGPATQPASAPAARPDAAPPVQLLTVTLFSPAKDNYALTVKMERFLKEAEAQVALAPIVTHQALRTTGLVAIAHSPRRSVEVRDAKNLARVDTGRLPEPLRSRPGVTAWRFLSADYGGTLAIGSVSPRITVHEQWALGADTDRLELKGRLTYTIERAGVFELSLGLPEPWEIVSVGPKDVVDDHQLAGKGADRKLNLLLKREVLGTVAVDIVARQSRAKPDEPVDFALPLPAAANLQMCTGQVVLFLARQFRAEIDKLDQLQPLPLGRAASFVSMGQLVPALAFDFQALDRARPAGGKFKIAVKTPQVSAVVYRLVNIQPGSIDQQAVVQYRILHAPVDTFYLKLPADLAGDVQITGRDIKEQPRIDALPADQETAGTDTPLARGMAWFDKNMGTSAPSAERVGIVPGAASAPSPVRPASMPAGKWAFFKIVLQAPVMDSYELTVTSRKAFQAGQAGKPVVVAVEPILAAGKLSDQVGYIAVAKADTLAIGTPESKDLFPGDPGSEIDLPYAPFRQIAALAFKYTAPTFALSLPVVAQQEADVFTKIVTAAILEQVIDRDGTLNTHATWLISTSRGDRLAFVLPAKAKLYSVLVNGAEAAVETGANADERIVRLPPSAGQVAKVVLEVTYGLDKASAANLAGPQLPKDIPVQQTLWRLWAPQEDYLLAYDRTFALLLPGEGDDLLRRLAAGQPAAVAFKLSGQGFVRDFARQGAPGSLYVLLAATEYFNIGVWAVILAVGALMLKLTGYRRCLIVLVAATAASVVFLFAPLLVRRLAASGVWPGVIVLGLWAAQWLFLRWPKARKAARPTPPPAPVNAAVAVAPGTGAADAKPSTPPAGDDAQGKKE